MAPSMLIRYAALALLFAVLAAGCADDGIGTTYPVSGKVTLDGKPIQVEQGYVMLKPNAEKGNTTPFEPTGTFDSSGNYQIYTKDRQGAPPGWYKVVVTATGKAPPPAKDKSRSRPIPKSLAPAKYGQAKSTPLEIEVVASPETGAYDLKLVEKP